MNKRQFVRTRRPEWEKFRKLLEQVEIKKFRKLKTSDVDDFSRLLRDVSNDLAIIRSREWGRELEEFLNHLVTRGYNSFYSAPPGRMRDFLNFAAFGFPRLLRQYWQYFAIAWSLFFIPLIVSWLVIQNNTSAASAILPAEQLEMMEQMYETGFGEQGGVVEGFGDQRSMMAGFYIKHNTGIAFASFAVGILLGVGTIYTLLFNGIILGAVSGYIVGKGHGENFLSFVVTHGSFELTAIAVAGGAGLMLGDAALHRGNRTLRDSFRFLGLDAVKIAFGAGLMLFVAAFVEGFWSPAPIPSFIKYAVGAACWVFVYAWLLLAGRGE